MTHDDTDHWSLNGQIMAWALAVEAVLALIAISYPELHHPGVLVFAAAVSIGSAVLAVRARMPGQIKFGLIAIVCAALLALAAAQDPFGLRAIDRTIDEATHETYGMPAPIDATAPHATTASSQVSLQGKGDASAAAFATDLARSVAIKSGGEDASYRVDGVIDVTTGASGDSYRLTWSLGHQAETLWCGRIVAVGQARNAVLDSFSTTIAAALRQSRSGTMTCS